MSIGHGQRNLRRCRTCGESGLPHGIQRVLDSEALVRSESFEQRSTNCRMGDVPVGIAGVDPIGCQARGKDAVGAVGQSSELIAMKVAPRRIRRFENQQIGNAGDYGALRTILFDTARPLFALAADERVRVRSSVHNHASPRIDLNVHPRRCDLRIRIEHVLTQNDRKRFGAVQFGVGSEGVDDVLHRVGGDDMPIIAGRIRICEIAGELHIDRPFEQVMAIGMALDFGQSHPRLPVSVMNEYSGHRL